MASPAMKDGGAKRPWGAESPGGRGRERPPRRRASPRSCGQRSPSEESPGGVGRGLVAGRSRSSWRRGAGCRRASR
eukprot:12533809-Heterocapsa_arctica.AAC.1